MKRWYSLTGVDWVEFDAFPLVPPVASIYLLRAGAGDDATDRYVWTTYGRALQPAKHGECRTLEQAQQQAEAALQRSK